MKKLLVVNAGLTALLGTGIAQAGFAPYYVGAGVGQSANNGDETQFCDPCSGSQFTVEDGGQGYKVYGGMNLTDSLAIEGEYTDLGKTFELDMYRPHQPPDGRAERASAYQKTRGIGISAKANRRITRNTAVYGKAGAFAWENKSHMDYTNLDNIHTTYSGKDSGISPTLGIGIEHEVSDRWTIRAGWDHYFDVGKGDRFLELDSNQNVVDLHSVKTDVDMVYVGATFNF